MAFNGVTNAHIPDNSMQVSITQFDDLNSKLPGIRQALNLLCQRSLWWMGKA